MAKTGDEKGKIEKEFESVYELDGWCFVQRELDEKDTDWDFVRKGEEKEDVEDGSYSFGDQESSSSSSAVNDVLDMGYEFQFEEASSPTGLQGYEFQFEEGSSQKINMKCSLVSPLRKIKEPKEIKVLVKDYVLPFLPAKSLVRFRSVSKEWDSWITGPFLAHQQSYYFKQLSGFFCQYQDMVPTFVTLDHHAFGVPTPSLTFIPEFAKIISSSHGLLLCQGANTYYVCNPANSEWNPLPNPTYYHGPEPATILAFEPSVLNMDAGYQLISAVHLMDQPIVYFEMYSSRAGYWRESNTICIELGENITFTGNMFYMKGVAYWETTTRKILAFNPTSEIHGIISLPYMCPEGGILAEMHEELCYISMSKQNQNECFVEIYGGMDMSLKQKIEMHFPFELHGYQVLHYVDGNELLLLIEGFLHSYSLTDHKVEVIRRMEQSPGTRYLPYVNSLVSIG